MLQLNLFQDNLSKSYGGSDCSSYNNTIIQLSRGEGWDPINQFNPATFFVPVQSQKLNFKRHMVFFFL